MLLGEKILKLSSEKEAKIDSIPLEATRYDENTAITYITGARSIMHILQWLRLFLVFSTHTRGLLVDPQELIKHI
jgi:hypothetical protein